MAQETIITNVGEDDVSSVASEATLLQLLSAMEDLAKKSGKDPASTQARAKKLAEEAQKRAVIEYTDVVKDKTKETKKATQSIGRMGRSFGVLIASFGAIAGVGANLVDTLIKGSDQLSDFTQYIPLIGSVITPLVQFIESTVDNFRSLSSVGAAFGNSLEDLRRSAATARLPLDEFSSLIQNNSERMIFLGSTVSDGARRFAEIAGELRGDDGLFGALKAMGFTTEEVNEGLANYINLQGRLGRIQGRTNAELAAGAAEYLHQMDRLAKATGRQRQEIERELERLNLDAAMLALENQIIDNFGEGSAEHTAFRDAQTRLAAMPEEMREAAISSMMGLPDATAAVLGSDFIEGWRGLATGAFPDPADAYAMIESSLEALGEAFDDPTVIRALQQSQLSGVTDILSASRRIREILNADLDEIDDEQARRDGIIENLTRFDDRIRDITSTIQEALIDSGVFDLVATSVASLASLINGPQGMAAIRNGIDSMVSFFRGFIDDVTEMGFMGAIKNAFVDLAMNIWEEISLRLFGGTRDTSDQQESIDTQIQDLERRRRSLGPEAEVRAGQRGEERSREMSALDAQLEQLRSRRESLIDQDGEEVEGVLSGFLGELFTLENIFSTGGVLLVGLAAGAVAIALIGTKAALVAAAIGLAAGGLGYLLQNLSPVIDSVFTGMATVIDSVSEALSNLIDSLSEGFTSAVEALEPMVDTVFSGIGSIIDSIGGNIQGIIDSLSEGFTSAVEALEPMVDTVFSGISQVIDSVGGTIESTITSITDGIANIIGRITEFRTAGTDATTSQIERLSQIESDQLVAAAEGITAMKTALEGFSSGAGSTLERIGSFFGRQTSEERQTSAFERLANLGPGLTQVSESLEQIASIDNIGENLSSITDDLDINSLRNFNNELQRLLEILNSINEEMSRDTRSRNMIGQRVGETANPAAEMLSGIGTGSSSGTETRLDSLNTTMVELLRVAQAQLAVLNEVEDNTDGISGDISRRGITSF